MSDRMKRDLLVFYGGGNPRVTPMYKEVYSLLRQLGEEQGYRRVYDEISWPGQCDDESYVQSPSVSLATSPDAAVSFIRTHIEGPYDILARCYGCFVALKIAGLKMSDLPMPRQPARGKGLKVDEQSFSSLEPIESLLLDVAVPTQVASGSLDPICTLEFAAYLRSITRTNPLVSYPAIVQGARHEVAGKTGDTVVEAYRQALWGPL